MALLFPNWAAASGLEYKGCSLAYYPNSLFSPITGVRFDFEGRVELREGAVGKILQGDKVVAEGVLRVSNYTDTQDPTGTVILDYEEPLLLPKGETFVAVLEKDAAQRIGNPELTNDEVRCTFTIPTDLGDYTCRLKEGGTVETSESITFTWRTETSDDYGTYQALLYREGVEVRKYPIYSSWDWDMGTVTVSFGKELCFEKGVNYSLVLPEGTVRGYWRPDITNKEVVLNFVGGYTEPQPGLYYVWCNLPSCIVDGKLGEVVYHYDQAVLLSPYPVVQLRLADNSQVVKEVTPTLAEEDGLWVLRADFGQTPLTSEKGYMVVIPEGTLVTADGDIAVNPRNTVRLDGATGLPSLSASVPAIAPAAGGIAVDGLAPGTPVSVYRADGTLHFSTRAATSSLLVRAGKGAYVVALPGLTAKVLVE